MSLPKHYSYNNMASHILESHNTINSVTILFPSFDAEKKWGLTFNRWHHLSNTNGQNVEFSISSTKCMKVQTLQYISIPVYSWHYLTPIKPLQHIPIYYSYTTVTTVLYYSHNISSLPQFYEYYTIV